MVLYIQETEMIERFSDSLKEASSRCKELIKAEPSDRPEIFVKISAALKISAGSAHQLSMAQMNPKWLMFRDTLEAFTVFAQEKIFKDSESPIWLVVAENLDKLAHDGQKMAVSRSLGRNDVLDEILRREDAAKAKLAEEQKLN